MKRWGVRGVVVAVAAVAGTLGVAAGADARTQLVDPRCLTFGAHLKPTPSIELNPHVDQCTFLY